MRGRGIRSSSKGWRSGIEGSGEICNDKIEILGEMQITRSCDLCRIDDCGAFEEAGFKLL